eukprot:TRINITY_DN9556_c1_g2_i1.p1 TRINITY_DN9556_c1_g2~~TRINITY_DN9556_c1_g2_i1.p1  ORF type:complete len:348 (+),score=51.93 TRINITY_DN9556_c1_g2_i1:136-1044(+)
MVGSQSLPNLLQPHIAAWPQPLAGTPPAAPRPTQGSQRRGCRGGRKSGQGGCSSHGSRPLQPKVGSAPLAVADCMAGSAQSGSLEPLALSGIGAGEACAPLCAAASAPAGSSALAAEPATPWGGASDRERRHRATVSRVGAAPMLSIQGMGEFPFAYRAVKKKPGEPRTLLAVGDIVECRLARTLTRKAVSVRILQGTCIPLAKGPREHGSFACSESTQGLTPQPSPQSTVLPRRDLPPALCPAEDDDSEDQEDEADVIPLCGAAPGTPDYERPHFYEPHGRMYTGRDEIPDMSWVEDLLSS